MYKANLSVNLQEYLAWMVYNIGDSLDGIKNNTGNEDDVPSFGVMNPPLGMLSGSIEGTDINWTLVREKMHAYFQNVLLKLIKKTHLFSYLYFFLKILSSMYL